MQVPAGAGAFVECMLQEFLTSEKVSHRLRLRTYNQRQPGTSKSLLFSRDGRRCAAHCSSMRRVARRAVPRQTTFAGQSHEVMAWLNSSPDWHLKYQDPEVSQR